jgi:hypothetical protein
LGGGSCVFALRLNESASVRCLALYLSRRHRFAAFADLSSDKERLGFRIFSLRSVRRLGLMGPAG